MIRIQLDIVKMIKLFIDSFYSSDDIAESERRLVARRYRDEQRRANGEEIRLRVGLNQCIYRKNGIGVLETMELKSSNFYMMKDVLVQEMKKHSFKRKVDNKVISHVEVINRAINEVELVMSFNQKKYERAGTLVDHIVSNIVKYYDIQPMLRRQKERRRAARAVPVNCAHNNKTRRLVLA